MESTLMIWQHAILIYLPPNEHFTNSVTDMNLKSIESAISLFVFFSTTNCFDLAVCYKMYKPCLFASRSPLACTQIKTLSNLNFGHLQLSCLMVWSANVCCQAEEGSFRVFRKHWRLRNSQATLFWILWINLNDISNFFYSHVYHIIYFTVTKFKS